ncbi:hypothetical protein E2C01_012790 [Portunus trituberculatus]|uniref:Uncharacterized protein n=1 Tax=Portunus trituberculatus TaxID=210409 RepID=A0A5B7DFC9_PORTR|nr:hypothetical protein [Portunus trituberculatus]
MTGVSALVDLLTYAMEKRKLGWKTKKNKNNKNKKKNKKNKNKSKKNKNKNRKKRASEYKIQRS